MKLVDITKKLHGVKVLCKIRRSDNIEAFIYFKDSNIYLMQSREPGSLSNEKSIAKKYGCYGFLINHFNNDCWKLYKILNKKDKYELW